MTVQANNHILLVRVSGKSATDIAAAALSPLVVVALDSCVVARFSNFWCAIKVHLTNNFSVHTKRVIFIVDF